MSLGLFPGDIKNSMGKGHFRHYYRDKNAEVDPQNNLPGEGQFRNLFWLRDAFTYR